MKYPGLPPAGDGVGIPAATWHPDLESPAVDAWRALGGPLPPAVAAIEASLESEAAGSDTPTAVAVRIALAEGLRRIDGGARAKLAAADAVAAAERLADPNLAAAAHLAASVRAWTVAAQAEAESELAAARRHVVPGTVAGAHCDLEASRLARLHNDTSAARRHTTGALEVFEATGDPDGRADAQRELAGIALVADEPAYALTWAQAALDHHRARGDRSLVVMAAVLEARATKPDDPRRAVDLLTTLQAEAVSLGSADLEVLVVTHLSQMLQTLCSEEPERWPEAGGALERAFELADDPFTRAELLNARALYQIRRSELSGVDADLDEAQRLYASIGNPAGLGSVARTRARARLLQATDQPSRRSELRREAARLWSEANALYLTANMPGAARSAVLDRLIGKVVLSGGTLGPDDLAALRPPGDAPYDQRTAVRALLIESYDHLQRGRTRRARRALLQARRMIGEHRDHQLAAATEMGLAQADLALGRTGQALDQLNAGLEELSRFDVAMTDPTQRSRFVAAIEPLTRQALALAVTSRDPETGLRLLEYRRTGRLSGLLRSRRRIRVTSEVSELLDELDRLRTDGAEGGTDLRSMEVGASAPWEDCHLRLADATTRLFAETYDPAGIDARGLVETLPPDCCALVLDRPDPERPDRLVRAVVPGGDLDRATVEAVALPRDALRLLDLLTGLDRAVVDVKSRLRSADLAPLTRILLGPLVDQLAAHDGPEHLLIVPTGGLWAVPYAGLPLATPHGTTTLVEQATLTLTPSLRFHAEAARRVPVAGAGAISWRSPDLSRDPARDELRALNVLGSGHVRAPDPEAVRDALRPGSAPDILAIAGHGIAATGLAHGVWLDQGQPLRAADLIGAGAPRLVLLGACGAGFTPGTEAAEPIGFSTLAICAGAQAVVGPCIELADTPETAGYLADLYRSLTGGEHPSVVHREVTAAWLADGRHRLRPLVEWAAIGVLGTVPTA